MILGDYDDKKNIDTEVFVYETAGAAGTSLEQLKQYFERIWKLADSEAYIYEEKQEAKVTEAYEQLTADYENVCADYLKSGETADWEKKTFEVNKITLLANPIETVNKEPTVWVDLIQLMQTSSTRRISFSVRKCMRI